MTMLMFVKMSRERGSLENLLSAVYSRGFEITEFSARPSLDRSFFFVRLGVMGEEGDALRTELAALKEINQVECLEEAAS